MPLLLAKARSNSTSSDGTSRSITWDQKISGRRKKWKSWNALMKLNLKNLQPTKKQIQLRSCVKKKTCHLSFFRKNAYTSSHTHLRTPTKNPASTCPFFTCPMGAFSSSTPWVPPQPLSSPARCFNCKTSPFWSSSWKHRKCHRNLRGGIGYLGGHRRIFFISDLKVKISIQGEKKELLYNNYISYLGWWFIFSYHLWKW